MRASSAPLQRRKPDAIREMLAWSKALFWSAFLLRTPQRNARQIRREVKRSNPEPSFAHSIDPSFAGCQRCAIATNAVSPWTGSGTSRRLSATPQHLYHYSHLHRTLVDPCPKPSLKSCSTTHTRPHDPAPSFRGIQHPPFSASLRYIPRGAKPRPSSLSSPCPSSSLTGQT